MFLMHFIPDYTEVSYAIAITKEYKWYITKGKWQDMNVTNHPYILCKFYCVNQH